MTDDSKFYLAATKEYDSGRASSALMAKALALEGGNEVKAKYTYIRLRAKQFSDVVAHSESHPVDIVEDIAPSTSVYAKRTSLEYEDEEEEEFADKNPAQFLSDLYRGNYSLPMTFWVYWIVYTNIGLLITSWILVKSEQMGGFLMLLTSIYGAAAIIGTWRAASQYEGPVIWSMLAKVNAGMGMIAAPLMILGSLIITLGFK